MRRWPSCTKTTATMIAIAMIGKKSFSVGPPLTQATTPAGALTRIDAKMRSEIPLPMPRLVISSPMYMRSVVPAVSVTTIRTKRPAFASRMPCRWNRYAYPADWPAASATVR